LILDKIAKDPMVTLVNAGTPMMVFNQQQRQQAGRQFVDVGIAEQEAATMATGLAKNGAKPIWTVYSTFMQRTYDQLWHDVALNNQPVTILVYFASVRGMNDESHLGFFDIPFLAHIPNFVYLAPTSKEEHLAMLDWAIDQKDHPVAIRVPVGPLKETGVPDETDYSILNKNLVAQQGSGVAIFGLGINPKFITGLDEELLDSLPDNHQLVVTLEDGVLEGSYGQMAASYLSDSNLKVQNYGVSKEFHDRYNADELLAENGITVENIVRRIVEEL